MADQDSSQPHRPSFTSFWKRSKEATGGRKITFVPSGASSQPPTIAPTSIDGESAQSAKDKAQIRRAQVRKAQIQHRQRKANYVKRLEMDIAGIREMISTAERERRVLKTENETIRAQLSGAMTLDAVPAVGLPDMPLSATGSCLFSDIDFDDLIMSMDMDEYTGTPIYQITSSSPSSNGPSHHGSPQSQPLRSAGLPNMTPERTQQAINFILALEHICWNHFDHAYFTPATADLSANESGHTLMASSIALQSAPPEIFEAITQTQQNLKKKQTRSDPVPHDVSWQASGLTLQSLYGLANSLNPSDKDLTPVQAWFELASQYPMSLLLRQDIVNQLKSAFNGVVKCIHYGAVIERTAFESVVRRIIVPALAPWADPGPSAQVVA